MAVIHARKTESLKCENSESAAVQSVYRRPFADAELLPLQASPAGCSEISDSDFCVLEDELDSGEERPRCCSGSLERHQTDA
jgi:hypothetical protein